MDWGILKKLGAIWEKRLSVAYCAFRGYCEEGSRLKKSYYFGWLWIADDFRFRATVLPLFILGAYIFEKRVTVWGFSSE